MKSLECDNSGCATKLPIRF